MKSLSETRVVRELLRWRNTTTWSLEGWLVCWREEKSLRQWVAVNAISWIAIYLIGFEMAQAMVLIALGGLVVIVELLNSSIEATVDFVSTDRHPLAKKAKDVASAAVFASAMLWLAVWVLALIG